MVLLAIFMEVLRTGVAQTEVLQIQPTSFNTTVDVVLSADNF